MQVSIELEIRKLYIVLNKNLINSSCRLISIDWFLRHFDFLPRV